MTAIAWRRHARFREGGNLPKCVVLGLDDSSLERSMYLEESNIGRRDFLQMTGARTVAASAGPTATSPGFEPVGGLRVFRRHCASAGKRGRANLV